MTTSASSKSRRVPPAANRGYAYDAAWNLNWLTNNGAASQFKVDVKNELTNWPDGRCGSDANGNLTNKPVDLSGDELVYTYDDENRLVDVKNLAVAFETVFVYDGLGRLRLREEYTGSGSEGGGGAAVPAVSSGLTLAYEIRYLYDGLRVIQERDSNNVPLVSYTRGTDLSGTLEGAGGIGGLLARSYGYSGGNWSTHDFYHADGNGNITYLETSAQGLAASYRYDAYGNTLSSSGSLAATNVYRFSSKEIHANSGMYYYLYRFYDPSTQRWLNRDPIRKKADSIYTASWGTHRRYLLTPTVRNGFLDTRRRLILRHLILTGNGPPPRFPDPPTSAPVLVSPNPVTNAPPVFTLPVKLPVINLNPIGTYTPIDSIPSAFGVPPTSPRDDDCHRNLNRPRWGRTRRGRGCP